MLQSCWEILLDRAEVADFGLDICDYRYTDSEWIRL